VDRERDFEEHFAKLRAEGLIREDQPAPDDSHIDEILRGFGDVMGAPVVLVPPGATHTKPVIQEPEEGDWPAEPPWLPGLGVAEGYEGKPLARVHVLLIPTDEGASVPAYLRWGGWNECPPPEYHVAALRSWSHRYGAELVGLSGDVMNLRITRRPAGREEALSLAREHFDYCNDIVWQGTGTPAPLAASLMASDWWYFWWD
jgi:hypothetical protein